MVGLDVLADFLGEQNAPMGLLSQEGVAQYSNELFYLALFGSLGLFGSDLKPHALDDVHLNVVGEMNSVNVVVEVIDSYGQTMAFDGLLH